LDDYLLLPSVAARTLLAAFTAKSADRLIPQ
jgi:hypothetical protein